MTLLVLATAAVLVGALAQSVSGIGFSLVCGPFLVAVLGPADGVRLGVALSLALNLVLLVRYRRAVDVRSALLLVGPAVVATPLLVRLLRQAPVRLAEALAGAVAVVGAAALAAGLRARSAQGRAGAVAAGVLSAATNVTAAIGGPPVALYAANAGWTADTTRATLQLYFLVLNVVALISLGLPDVEPVLLASSATALAVGLVAGAPLARRVPDAAARRTTLGLAGAGGLVVLVRALL